MKVRVVYTTEVSHFFRLALCHSWGECGRYATRAEVKQHLELVGSANDDDLLQECQDCPFCSPRGRGESGPQHASGGS